MSVKICITDQFDCEPICPLTMNLPHIESIYRPPNTNFDLFHTFIENNFTLREYLPSDHIICGDFNINLQISHELQKDASMLYSNLKSKVLLSTISRPTRRASSSCTLIENFFGKNLNIFKSGVFTIDKTDIFPIFMKCDNYFAAGKLSPIQISYRFIKETTLNDFYQDFKL